MFPGGGNRIAPIGEAPNRRAVPGAKEKLPATLAQVITIPREREMPEPQVVPVDNEAHARHITEESWHWQSPFHHSLSERESTQNAYTHETK